MTSGATAANDPAVCVFDLARTAPRWSGPGSRRPAGITCAGHRPAWPLPVVRSRMTRSNGLTKGCRAVSARPGLKQRGATVFRQQPWVTRPRGTAFPQLGRNDRAGGTFRVPLAREARLWAIAAPGGPECGRDRIPHSGSSLPDICRSGRVRTPSPGSGPEASYVRRAAGKLASLTVSARAVRLPGNHGRGLKVRVKISGRDRHGHGDAATAAAGRRRGACRPQPTPASRGGVGAARPRRLAAGLGGEERIFARAAWLRFTRSDAGRCLTSNKGV